MLCWFKRLVHCFRQHDLPYLFWPKQGPLVLYSISPAVIFSSRSAVLLGTTCSWSEFICISIQRKRKAIVNSTRLSFTLESLVISWISTITPRTSFGTLLNNTHIFEPNTQYYIFEFGTTEILGRWDSPRSANNRNCSTVS